MKQKVLRIGLISAILVTLSACVGFQTGGGVAFGMTGSSSPGTQTVPAVGNNETVTLEAGTYGGNVRINGNNSTVQGAGVGATTIAGDLTISGNKVTMRNLTIRGDVLIRGNNADLTGARIAGKVTSRGNNSRW